MKLDSKYGGPIHNQKNDKDIEKDRERRVLQTIDSFALRRVPVSEKIREKIADSSIEWESSPTKEIFPDEQY